MITLKKLAGQFIDDVHGGGKTVDSRMSEKEVILKIRQLMNEVMVLKYFEKQQEGDRSAITLYISTYELSMQNDTNLNRAYVTIPEFYASLPYNRGIHRIFLKDNPYQDVVISHNPGISANLRAGNVHGILYCYLEGFDVIFRNIAVEPDEEPAKVIVQLIIAAPDKIGDNDPLPIIPEQQFEILKRLRQFYIPVPIDLANNGNPNQ